MKVAKTIFIVSVLIACFAILWIGAFGEIRPHVENTEPTVTDATLGQTTAPTTQPTEDTTEPTIQPTEEVPKYYPIDNDKKYVGVYINDPQELDLFENGTNIIGWFDTFDNPSEAKISMCLDNHEGVAFITLEPQGMSIYQIPSGKYDEQIINYLTLLSAGDRVNTELFIRFAHEMEMRPSYEEPWYGWQGYDGDAYINAWKHVVDLGREYAPNVKWVWSPNRADKYTTRHYPGDDYVDYVGLTLNNYRSMHDSFENFYLDEGSRESLEAYNKPIIFGEVAEHCSDEDQKNEYLASIFEYIKNDDNVIGFMYLNKDIREGREYKISDNETQLATFVEKAMELINCEKQN